jgi:hypothetical protein
LITTVQPVGNVERSIESINAQAKKLPFFHPTMILLARQRIET